MGFGQDKKSVFAVTVVLFCLGALLMASVRTRVGFYQKVPTRLPVLADRYINAQEEIKRLRQEVQALREKIDKYEESASETSRVVADMKKELDSARVAMGYTKVKGPGIVLILDDSKKRLKPMPMAGIQLDIVHDYDLFTIVNELKNSGAEAISINGQRVVATTSIRCVGTVIRVNDVSIANPYEIRALGDPDTLESGVEIRGGILDDMQTCGIRIQIEKKQEIVLPEFSGRVLFKYAKPVK